MEVSEAHGCSTNLLNALEQENGVQINTYRSFLLLPSPNSKKMGAQINSSHNYVW